MTHQRDVFDISLKKTLPQGGSSFELDVQWRTHYKRVAILGPSGSGKTLTLAAIAGLLDLDSAYVRVNGHTFVGDGICVPAHHRQLGVVFQDYALFPHLTVRQNIAFGLAGGLRNPSNRSTQTQVEHWIAQMGLRPNADQYPATLSGGQRQRTALARALACRPRALLLDEPFAALDTPLKSGLRSELASVQADLDIPLVIVTHDPQDAEALADVVIHLDAGRAVSLD